MPVTVAALLADRGLALATATTTAPIDRPLAWVHVSELADPTPFLDGGELLLTTGLALDEGVGFDAYVGRLVDAGVAALGFGTGLGYDEVPAELVAAAEARGLAVLEVPRRTPFIAISRSVAAALAAEEYAAVARSAAAQQELARAALAPGAPGTVLQRLTRASGVWALLLDAAGAVVEAHPPSAAGRAGGLRPELDHLRRTRAPAGAAISGPDGTVLLQSLGNGARTRAFLVVGRPGPVPPADRFLVNAAALLLTLRLEQSHALDAAMAELRTALLRLLAAGERQTAAVVLEALGEQLPAEPVQVVTLVGSAGDRTAAADLAAEAAGLLGGTLFRAEADGALVLVTAADDPVLDDLLRIPEAIPGTAAGSSGAVPWPRLAEALRGARQAADQAARRGGGTVTAEDLAGGGLLRLVDGQAGRAFADALLAPLRAADRTSRGDLVASLRTWLAYHGQNESAAAELGVHRHTLRNRIRRAGELLGRDLDSPGVRAELWLALQIEAD